ncbi:MAG: aspartate aminotransferase family protein [Candidatus Tectimicrobiota bacterium]|nr:MAG: aspartate aminotransferase family protein [Candidatus Tectomicrobia bacterium]
MARETRSIAEEYAARFAQSRQLFAEAQALLPGGITHMARAFDPFPLYIDRCVGAYKWDVDGNQYIDYWMGHGAMLLGHAHPEIVAAIQAQASRGTHAGGNTRLEMEWARLLTDLVPCAEQVKFTSSGTEATLLALRAARVYTGKRKIIKFAGHFHGWHDYVACGVLPPYDVPMSPGIPEAVQQTVLVLPFNDKEALTQALESSDDIAAVIVEPGGAYNDTVPADPTFLTHLRQETARRGVVLIFDEVVTGFRYAVGGAQEYFNVIPDLTTLAKIMAGGLNGGAVVGRRDIMEVFAPGADPVQARYHRIPHPGTFNANPLSAAAGIAALRLIATGEPTKRAQEMADLLRQGINEVLARRGIPGCAYGRASIFKTFIGAEPPRLTRFDFRNAREEADVLLQGTPLAPVLRKGLLLNGVDLMRVAGFVSAAHTPEIIEATVQAFDRTLARMQQEGLVP